MHNSPQSTRKGSQDLLHSLILLAVVPLLFFAGWQLVKKTAELPSEPKNPVVQEVKDKASPILQEVKETTAQIIHKALPPRPPPPGEAWLRELTALQQRIETLRPAPTVDREQIDHLRERLAMLRQHVERCVDDVPPYDQERQPLKQALLRISDEIVQVSEARSALPARPDWKQAYSTAEANDRAVRDAAVAKEEKRTLDPIKQQHQTELATVARESRDLGDQVQAIRDKQSNLQNKTNREIDRIARRTAFEKDRAEIQRLLSPFIARSIWQIRKNARDWVKVVDPQPLSWSKLERVGALQPTQDGIEALALIGTQQNLYPNTPRPLGSFPGPDGAFFSKPHNIEATKRAQHLLKTHGPTLVEEGLLAP